MSYNCCQETGVVYPGVEDLEVECDRVEDHEGLHCDPWFGEWGDG